MDLVNILGDFFKNNESWIRNFVISVYAGLFSGLVVLMASGGVPKDPLGYLNFIAHFIFWVIVLFFTFLFLCWFAFRSWKLNPKEIPDKSRKSNKKRDVKEIANSLPLVRIAIFLLSLIIAIVWEIDIIIRVIFLIVVLCALFTVNSKDKLKIVAFFSGLIITGIISNQLVQPLFTPRLSDMQITPLYVQFFEDGREYYTVHRVSYKIEAPVAPFFGNNIDLKVPGYFSPFEDDLIWYPSQKVYLIGSLYEHNPYIKIPTKYFNRSTNIDLEDSNGKLRVSLDTGFFSTKEVNFNIYIMEKADIEMSNLAYPNHRWWNHQSVSPDHEYNIARYGQLLGYATNTRYKEDPNLDYHISEDRIKNMNDLPIRGFRVHVQEDYLVCLDGIELNRIKECYGDTEFCVKLDLDPKETKTLLIQHTVPASSVSPNSVRINYSSENRCPGLWAEYLSRYGNS